MARCDEFEMSKENIKWKENMPDWKSWLSVYDDSLLSDKRDTSKENHDKGQSANTKCIEMSLITEAVSTKTIKKLHFVYSHLFAQSYMISSI